MTLFVIVETQDGLTIADVPPDVPPVAVAEQQGGVLVEDNVYDSYEEAYDGLLSLRFQEEEMEGRGRW